MGIFDKVMNTTANTIRMAVDKGNDIMVSTQREINLIDGIKADISAIDAEMNSAYLQIGKKYFEYYLKSNSQADSIGADDFLKIISSKKAMRDELDKELLELEKRLKDKVLLQEKAKAHADIDAQTDKLNQAKAMGVITEAEYNEKLTKLKKRLDNFEAVRNIEKQFEMGIITYSEMEKKLAELQ